VRLALGIKVVVAGEEEVAGLVILHGLHGYGRLELVALKKALKTLYSPIDRGLLVVDVVPGSPAEEVGLARGDVVTRVNDIFELGSSWESL